MVLLLKTPAGDPDTTVQGFEFEKYSAKFSLKSHLSQTAEDSELPRVKDPLKRIHPLEEGRLSSAALGNEFISGNWSSLWDFCILGRFSS